MRENDCIILEQVHTCLNYEELFGSKISSFGSYFLSRIDSIEFAKKYLNSRFRSETRFQSCFTQNDEDFAKMISLFSQYSFWMRKVVIWWLFNDDLRAREREPEKKEPENPGLSKISLSLETLMNQLNKTKNLCKIWTSLDWSTKVTTPTLDLDKGSFHLQSR